MLERGSFQALLCLSAWQAPRLAPDFQENMFGLLTSGLEFHWFTETTDLGGTEVFQNDNNCHYTLGSMCPPELMFW